MKIHRQRSSNTFLRNTVHKKLTTSFKTFKNTITIVISDESTSCHGTASSSSIKKNDLPNHIDSEGASSNFNAVLAPDTPEGTVYGLLDESVRAAAIASGIVSIKETPDLFEARVRKQNQGVHERASKRHKSKVGCGRKNVVSQQMLEFGDYNEKSTFRDTSSFMSPRLGRKMMSPSPIHNRFKGQKTAVSSQLNDRQMKRSTILLYPSLKTSNPKHVLKLQAKAVTGRESRLLKLLTNVPTSSSSECNSVADGQQMSVTPSGNWLMRDPVTLQVPWTANSKEPTHIDVLQQRLIEEEERSTQLLAKLTGAEQLAEQRREELEALHAKTTSQETEIRELQKVAERRQLDDAQLETIRCLSEALTASVQRLQRQDEEVGRVVTEHESCAARETNEISLLASVSAPASSLRKKRRKRTSIEMCLESSGRDGWRGEQVEKIRIRNCYNRRLP